MSRDKARKQGHRAPANLRTQQRRKGGWLALGAVLLISAALSAVLLAGKKQSREESTGASSGAPKSTNQTPATPPSMPVAKAVMVTVDLDFGPKVPTIAEALREVERRHQPNDGKGRTFAILDAYGEPSTNGKLHISMHVSTEKPGVGALVFRRTGEILWQSRIVLETNSPATAFTGKDLLVLLDDGAGKTFTVDGAGNPASILEARIKQTGVLIRDFWPDGAEREVTFLYSACGCPVKVKARRVGERTARTSELPVIFPDDPAVIPVIAGLMRW